MAEEKKLDINFFKNAGKTGGQNTLKKYGKDHFTRISQLAAKKRAENKKAK